MKPIVLTKEADGTVKMTIDEFRQYIEDAYNQGRCDAGNSNWYSSWASSKLYTGDRITITCNECSPSVTL